MLSLHVYSDFLKTWIMIIILKHWTRARCSSTPLYSLIWEGKSDNKNKLPKSKTTFNTVNMPTFSMKRRNKIYSSRFQVVDITKFLSHPISPRTTVIISSSTPNSSSFSITFSVQRNGPFLIMYNSLSPIFVIPLNALSSSTTPLLNIRL